MYVFILNSTLTTIKRQQYYVAILKCTVLLLQLFISNFTLLQFNIFSSNHSTAPRFHFWHYNYVFNFNATLLWLYIFYFNATFLQLYVFAFNSLIQHSQKPFLILNIENTNALLWQINAFNFKIISSLMYSREGMLHLVWL